ncbi:MULTISPECIES: universal stress protein [Cyanophyceae]|uniref:universal stress protein n=1 Tax=Cyanophyceae TaxID=3028117 RepID=UPI001684A9B2|nr:MULTISPECIES: universal stress protein [Cyanophyceae]MBD1914749.1 universal stress protein [Phormidium sp. FACHB-77]MBD2030852.1 universal stress protein [Phormidium sp. FACHB-322]MBD2052451.1 universal stress protein [Leptolyngbya sp. FACHB-60]
METSLNRILVALDGTHRDREVLRFAIAQAQHHNGHLLLVHYLSPLTLTQLNSCIDEGFGLMLPAKRRQIQNAHLKEVNGAWQWLCNYALQAQSQRVSAEVTCKIGEASSQICAMAKQWRADLIVMGRGGRPSLTSRLFGRITIQVVQHSPCTTMVVQPKQQPAPGLPTWNIPELRDRFHAPEGSVGTCPRNWPMTVQYSP